MNKTFTSLVAITVINVTFNGQALASGGYDDSKKNSSTNDFNLENENEMNVKNDIHNDVDVDNHLDVDNTNNNNNKVDNTNNNTSTSNGNNTSVTVAGGNKLNNTNRLSSNSGGNRLNNNSSSKSTAVNGGNRSNVSVNGGSTITTTTINYPRQNPGAYSGPAQISGHPYNCNNGLGAGFSNGSFSFSASGSSESDTCAMGVKADLANRYMSPQVSCNILAQDDDIADAMKKSGYDCSKAGIIPTKVIVVDRDQDWKRINNSIDSLNKRIK